MPAPLAAVLPATSERVWSRIVIRLKGAVTVLAVNPAALPEANAAPISTQSVVPHFLYVLVELYCDDKDSVAIRRLSAICVGIVSATLFVADALVEPDALATLLPLFVIHEASPLVTPELLDIVVPTFTQLSEAIFCFIT